MRLNRDKMMLAISERTVRNILVLLGLLTAYTSQTIVGKELKSPVFLEPIPNVTMPSGRDVRLACVVDHLGSYKVAWIQQDRSAILTVGKHVITRNPRIGVLHDEHRTWYLTITDVRPGDAGTYMCQINTEPVTSQIGIVEVVVPPYIKDDMTSKDVKLHEGAGVSLACSARGSPIPTIKWRREDGDKIRVNDTFKAMQILYPILKLSNLKREDMAAYLCIASNGVPPSVSKRINVEVKFRPTVTAAVQLMSVPLGQMATLVCDVEAWPLGLNYWKRPGGHRILQNDRKYNASTEHGSLQMYKSVMKLTINDFSMADNGNYNCISNNSQGGAEQVIIVSASNKISNNPNSIEKRPTLKNSLYSKNNHYTEKNWDSHLHPKDLKEIDENNYAKSSFEKPIPFDESPKSILGGEEGLDKQLFQESFPATQHEQQSAAMVAHLSAGTLGTATLFHLAFVIYKSHLGSFSWLLLLPACIIL